MEIRNLIVYTVGGTPEPIIKSILTYKPEICYFICSKESEALTNKILAEVQNKNPTITVTPHTQLVKNHEDIIECYRTAHQTLKEAKEKHPNHTISIDYTGGTKIHDSRTCSRGNKIRNKHFQIYRWRVKRSNHWKSNYGL